MSFLSFFSNEIDSIGRRLDLSLVSEMEFVLVLLVKVKVGIKIDNYNKNFFIFRLGFLFFYILEFWNILCFKDI